MKKLILTLLFGGLMMTGLSAKTAFVYFSATGTTERMAKNAAEAMGADLFEIQPVHKYTAADLEPTEKVPITAFLSIFSVTLFKNYRKRTLKILRSEVFQWPR